MKQISVTYKMVFLLIDAMEFRIAAYQRELETLSDDADGDRKSDIDNDLAYLKGMLPDWKHLLASFP